ncbi:hypothetical protein PIB30_104569, partial [Stylosanthes scabra]|nr:hypothetical protein [Stylosanthes scabra]
EIQSIMQENKLDEVQADFEKFIQTNKTKSKNYHIYIFTNNQNRAHMFNSPAMAPFDEAVLGVVKKLSSGFPCI